MQYKVASFFQDKKLHLTKLTGLNNVVIFENVISRCRKDTKSSLNEKYFVFF